MISIAETNQNKIMEIEEIFRCPVCKREYATKKDAKTCMNQVDEQIVSVGDIVELKYGFGWFDGERQWVINPDVDMSKHGFSKDRSMGFYYVVTHIDNDNHRTRYHVATKAMSGSKGYSRGYTYNTGHYRPEPIDAPEFVIKHAKSLIGEKATYLL